MLEHRLQVCGACSFVMSQMTTGRRIDLKIAIAVFFATH